MVYPLAGLALLGPGISLHPFLHHLYPGQNLADCLAQDRQRILIRCETKAIDRLDLVDLPRQLHRRLRVLQSHEHRDVVLRAGLDCVVDDLVRSSADVEFVPLLFLQRARDLGADMNRAGLDFESHRLLALPQIGTRL